MPPGTGKGLRTRWDHTEMIKHSALKAKSWVLDIFNKCAETSNILNGWGKPRVVSLLKPERDPTSKKSYRPISLLFILYKLYKRMFMALTIEQELIPDQAGFQTRAFNRWLNPEPYPVH